ncbi:DUF3325 domain-containing protein [Enterovirga aerilata]|uniref:DUF3325 domain-containing protein n=1 Tax=Enterovirga aerilata TaxID=2730920 RepID=A0A849I8M6_9HYPH|nr:DUF3325 domain-containing protein [Enterovirga sp. DB1703]NNM74144.1 DUF3325 domain-containing protein [Enterovirga sp. DB1703]
MSHLVALVLCVAGFGGLALATDRQQHAVFGRALPEGVTYGLRIAGAAALLLALGSLVVRQGWGLGLVMFSGHTSLASGLVHATLIGYSRLHSSTR